ncbi:MAG: M15 family metallopeptidase [Treponema sp.]|jgi:hypothetical protein|nr:M15 family metallopeptidase [Treponema sp.]
MSLSEREKGLVDLMESNARNALLQALSQMDSEGIEYYISETKRDLTTQLLYALNGRLDDISFAQLQWAWGQHGKAPPANNVKQTWTLQSNHFDGTAVDMVPYDPIKKVPLWSVVNKRMVEIMKGYGFAWGGDWGADKYDPPHWEFKGR